MSSDSSELASIAAGLQFNNYLSLATTTALIYDYIITFSKEIDYIWNRPWTFVSAMFIIVRYLGLGVALVEGLYGSTFIPGPTLVLPHLPACPTVDNGRLVRIQGTVLLLASDNGYTIFLAAADIVMILRVYAMYNKSRIVLGLLLVFYVAMLIIYPISSAYYNNPNTSLTMTTPQVLDMSFCNPEYNITSQIGKYKYIPRRGLSGLLVAFAVARFCMDSYQAYQATKRWEVNKYVNLLVKEGVFYFLVHLLNTFEFGQNAPGLIANTAVFVVLFVLSPRFIMNVRELHLGNMPRVSGQCHIDTAFGFSKGRSSTRVTDASSVGFVHSLAEGDVEMVALGGHTEDQC